MQTSFRMVLTALARRAYVPAAIALSFFGLAVAAAQPGPVHARSAVEKAVARLNKARPARIPLEKVIVWRGLDIDGDGAADFINPTGAAPRTHDHFGSGAFGARRDGGSRSHEGVDYGAVANQAVRAPISGYVTKIGYAYGGDDSLKFVEITNPALGYVARTFYIDPLVKVGDIVRLGGRIGTAESLQSHYPGITDHVHLEIMDPTQRRIDAGRVITARLVLRPATQAG
ncbi:MAG: M23 family metallopeptidase [Pseudomonadota bacterium]